MRVSLAEAAAHLGLPPEKVEGEACFDGVSLDSRKCGEGNLFVGLKGPRQDGGAYAVDALRAGAAAALVNAALEPSIRASVPERWRRRILFVDDTERALFRLAFLLRRKLRNTVFVAVTGSNGKTTTKEYIRHVLERAGLRTGSSAGNFNNLQGVPVSLSLLRGDEQVAVFEMGMSSPGEISSLSRLLRPQVGVVTCVAPVHLETLGDVGRVREAKAEILHGMEDDETVMLVLNMDDPQCWAIGERAAGRYLVALTTAGGDEEAFEEELPDVELPSPASSAGLHEASAALDEVEEAGIPGRTALVRFSVQKVELTSLRGRLLLDGESCDEVVLPVCGRHMAYPVLAAAAVARLRFAVPLERILDACRTLPRVWGRMHPRRCSILSRRVTLLMDCYNANPASMTAALLHLRESVPESRRVAVLGDMLELGSRAPEYHQQVLELAASIVPWRRLMLVGDTFASLPDAEEFCCSPDEIPERLDEVLHDDDVVLVKGSRGMALEERIPVDEAGGEG